MATSTFDELWLQVFYSRLFPYEQMYEWLNYGHESNDEADPDRDCFFRREFSFTKANDVYIRYLSFRDANEFKERTKKEIPHKIDIGAVFSFPAKDHTTVAQSKFKPMLRELVFDIDLTDYEEVMNQPKDSKSIWSGKAWGLMACAIKVIDATLREDFGYEHILWVFSGRRGVHCWVCDESALKLEDSERTAIVDYLSVITGGGKSDEHLDQRIKLTDPRHPMVRRALQHCRSFFLDVCVREQDLLGTEERWTRVLNMLPDIQSIRKTLADEWSSDSSASSEKRWVQLEKTVQAVAQHANTSPFQKENLLKAVDSIVLFHTYPRLDVNVSTHRNHLLKSPFVVHPKTGNVCVPIFQVNKCEEFDPDRVPTLRTLIEEVNESVEKTSLQPYLDKFESQFLQPLRRAGRARNRQRQEKAAAVTGSW